MRIEVVFASIFYLNIGGLTGESMGISLKIAFSSHISLQYAFINPIGRLFKRLFPLGHKELFAPVMMLIMGLKTRNLGLRGFGAFTLFTDSTVYSQLKFALCIISHVGIGLIPLKPTRRYFSPHHVSAQLQ